VGVHARKENGDGHSAAPCRRRGGKLGAWFTASGGGIGGGLGDTGVTHGGGGLARAVRGRARVRWRDAWEQGRKGAPGTWAVVAECGPVALGRPKGIVSFVNYSKIFK
jgi:hypothetical protein